MKKIVFLYLKQKKNPCKSDMGVAPDSFKVIVGFLQIFQTIIVISLVKDGMEQLCCIISQNNFITLRVLLAPSIYLTKFMEMNLCTV